MNKVFILSIIDDAAFDKIMHRSAWSSKEKATEFAQGYVAGLVDADESGLGDTFGVTIMEFEVREE